MVLKKHKKRKRALIVFTAVILAFVIGCGIYVNDYYHADAVALQAVESDEQILVSCEDDGRISFVPRDMEASTGLIFYPGGKVQYESYAPLMRACAERGILCVLVKMPFNLAVLDIDAADGIQEQYPQVENWYIGGHSLGGSMAASYLGKHADEYEGIVLLAAYSTEDLSETGLHAISVYGTEDGVLNMDKYEQYRGNLPSDLTEKVIDGGCHAFFGSYGAQDGDGEPEISAEEQIRITADVVAGGL